MTLRPKTVALVAALGLLASAGHAKKAAPPAAASRGWPCEAEPQQALSLAQYWPESGRAPTSDTWQSDPATAALVADIAPRSLGREEGVARIRNHASHATDRRQTMARLVAGLVETIDFERRTIIAGIRHFNDRQGQLAHRIEEGYRTLDALPPAATEQRAAVQEQVGWDTRVFEDRQRMLPIVCRQPALLESRLRAFAEAARAAANEDASRPR